jgi:hypothetical protein
MGRETLDLRFQSYIPLVFGIPPIDSPGGLVIALKRAGLNTVKKTLFFGGFLC